MQVKLIFEDVCFSCCFSDPDTVQVSELWDFSQLYIGLMICFTLNSLTNVSEFLSNTINIVHY